MKRVLYLILLGFLFTQLKAQETINPAIKTSKAVMDDFMDQRFGMFVHWGPVTLRGTEIGWSRGNQVPAAEYDNLYKEFNPVLFSADAWVKAAKDAGMKYFVITAKHHDGFLLWPSAVSSYNIMYTPYKVDVVGELAKACKKYGIKFCVYFTVLDWHDPNYPIRLSSSKEIDPKADVNKFVTTMKAELKELVTKYNPYLVWFDGNWEKPWEEKHGVEIYTYLKQLKPNLIINNRIGKGSHTKLKGSLGDYATPEQFVGAMNMDDPWETCMTICKQWAWKPNDSLKTLKQCIQTLARSSGGNGNLLFNVGPMADGRIEARQITRLKEMGDWLKIYGESIYKTKGGPYKPNQAYATTRKGNRIYIHVFEQKSNQLVLPALFNVKIIKASLLKGAAITFQQGQNGVTLSLPQLPDPNDSVIVLELNASTENLPVIGEK